jgi:hypothetical protein
MVASSRNRRNQYIKKYWRKRDANRRSAKCSKIKASRKRSALAVFSAAVLVTGRNEIGWLRAACEIAGGDFL